MSVIRQENAAETIPEGLEFPPAVQECVRKTRPGLRTERLLVFPLKDGKGIAVVSVCVSCRRELPYDSRRRACPFCLGILRTKTKVLRP